MKELKVELTFTEDILGTSPSNGDIYKEFIGSKAPDASTIDEEVADLGVDEVINRGKTVFPRLDGRPFLYDYQIKGFFKDSCSMLSRLSVKDETGKKKTKNESGKLTAFKKVIDGLIFVSPRKIPFEYAGDMTDCERPLRAQTAQGDRVALAISETVPAGAKVQFTVQCLDDSHVAAVKEWLDYGSFRGIGQWRNSGKGRFTWEEITCGSSAISA